MEVDLDPRPCMGGGYCTVVILLSVIVLTTARVVLPCAVATTRTVPDFAASWPFILPNISFLDLPGKLACENPPSTIPNDLWCTNNLKPDVMMLTDSQFCLDELTVQWTPFLVTAKEKTQQTLPYNSLFIMASGKFSSVTYILIINWIVGPLRTPLPRTALNMALGPCAPKQNSYQLYILNCRRGGHVWTYISPLLFV